MHFWPWSRSSSWLGHVHLSFFRSSRKRYLNALREQLRKKKGPHSTRRRLGLTDAGNFSFQLLQCTSGQGTVTRVDSDMPIYLFSEVLEQQISPDILIEALLTCLWNGLKCFPFVTSAYYSVLLLYLGT